VCRRNVSQYGSYLYRILMSRVHICICKVSSCNGSGTRWVTKPENRNFRARVLDRSSIVKPIADSHDGWGGGACTVTTLGSYWGTVMTAVNVLMTLEVLC
jgi:hypothetical protein